MPLAMTTDEAAGRLVELLKAPAWHEDGVYFGMPQLEYRADRALGSGDMMKLAYSPADYWYGSWMNPNRPPDDSSEYLLRGQAVHVLVLEGRELFNARFMRGPDQDGMSTAQKRNSTMKANEEAAALGKECLRARDYDRVAIAGAMIMRNAKLATAFQGGAAEVSVFWTDVVGGRLVRKKSRLDYLKPRGVGDLKSVANQHEVPFPRACLNAVTNYNYHVQAAHYMAARAVLPALIRDGKVWGPGGDQLDPATYGLLQGLLDAKRWGWQWVFWQSERAPITYSRVLSPGNPMLEVGAAVLHKAEQNFLEFSDLFGESMWVEEAEPAELYLEDMPPWFARD